MVLAACCRRVGSIVHHSSCPPCTRTVPQVSLWSMAALLTPPEAAPPGQGPLRPLVTTLVPAGDVQHSIRFSPNNPAELISNGRRRVYFWSWAPGSPRFQYYSPPLRSRDFKQSVGDFVSSVFVPGTTQALTATTDGDLVVWDEQGIAAQVGPGLGGGLGAVLRRAVRGVRGLWASAPGQALARSHTDIKLSTHGLPRAGGHQRDRPPRHQADAHPQLPHHAAGHGGRLHRVGRRGRLRALLRPAAAHCGVVRGPGGGWVGPAAGGMACC